MKHHRKRVLAATGLAAVAALVVTALFVVPALATPPSGLMNILLARGTDVSDGTLPLQVGTDIVMAQITVDPGGSSGWHSHPGGAIIVVKQGTPTVYRSIGSQCQSTTYSAGARVHRATWRSGRRPQRGHDSIRPLRHLPACASRRLREN